MFVGRADYQNLKHLRLHRIELPEIEHQVLLLNGIANARACYTTSRRNRSLAVLRGNALHDADVTSAFIRSKLAE